jgi:hypothetical protein
MSVQAERCSATLVVLRLILGCDSARFDASKKEENMTRGLILLAVATAALCFSGVALSDPSHNVLPDIVLRCSDGQTVTVLPGTSTNNSAIAFVRDSTSILVAKSFLATQNGEPVFGFVRGLNGFADKDLVTCTGPWTLGDVTFNVTVTGFLTPAHL